MKKLFAALLAIIMVLTVWLPALAADTDGDAAEAAIIVPGVIETMLTTDPSAGRDGRFYAPVRQALPGALSGLVCGAVKALCLGRYDTLVDAALKIEDAALKNLTMNPDGTSVYEIYTPVSGAEESSYAAMLESGKWEEVEFGAKNAPDIAAELGAENVFVFDYDWRLGSPTITARFAEFFEEVVSLTGCEKVDLYGDSYGCQILATYLYKYGCDERIGRMVFDSPAWTGTRLFKSLMADTEDDLYFHITDGAKVLLDSLMIETDLRPLLRLLPDRLVQRLAFEMIRHAMQEYLLAAPGLWCCCAADDYEEMKAKLLDPVENAAVIAEVDEAQYGVMRHVPEILAEAQAAGISVAVIMNEGIPLMAGKDINGDGVIDAAGGSGGECLPFGETFTDGRTGAHISPSNDYDLTNAFLPDRTWVFYGQVHGQSSWDDAARELVVKLMLTDEIETVFSDPRFPQFSDSHCPTCDVSVRLEGRGGSELFAAEGPVRAVIRNDSEKNAVLLTGVTVRGVGYTVSRAAGFLRPGQTKTVTLTPDENAASGYGSVTVSYLEFDMIPQTKTRTQFFKVTVG